MGPPAGAAPSGRSERRIAVVGLGHRRRGRDSLAVAVAEQVAEPVVEDADRPQVALLARARDGPALAQFALVRLVIADHVDLPANEANVIGRRWVPLGAARDLPAEGLQIAPKDPGADLVRQVLPVSPLVRGHLLQLALLAVAGEDLQLQEETGRAGAGLLEALLEDLGLVLALGIRLGHHSP